MLAYIVSEEEEDEDEEEEEVEEEVEEDEEEGGGGGRMRRRTGSMRRRRTRTSSSEKREEEEDEHASLLALLLDTLRVASASILLDLSQLPFLNVVRLPTHLPIHLPISTLSTSPTHPLILGCLRPGGSRPSPCPLAFPGLHACLEGHCGCRGRWVG